ncbi:MAG: hypothetical protein F4108_00660 [Acidimicrobiaceae bacterium]|nr:hypothetical protein [Acidimicrobiaceae bacterium]
MVEDHAIAGDVIVNGVQDHLQAFGVAGVRQRKVHVGQALLVVVAEVVRDGGEADDQVDLVAPQPDDLLESSHAPVPGAVATGPLAHAETLGDDPAEPARLDALRPLAAHEPSELKRWTDGSSR